MNRRNRRVSTTGTITFRGGVIGGRLIVTDAAQPNVTTIVSIGWAVAR